MGPFHVRRAIGLALIAVACGAPSQPRRPAAHARLSVAPESFVDDGPFRVVFAGPKGESGPTAEVTIAFSRPLLATGVLADAVSAATITRVHDGSRVEGTWRWFGQRTAVFWPRERSFANACEYEVSVDPRLRAHDGSALTTSPHFRFVSQRPALVSASYAWNEDEDRHTISVDFNQAMPRELLPTMMHIEGRGPRGLVSVPFTIDDGEDETHFELVVDRSVATLEDVGIVTAPSLSSQEGPLPSGREERFLVPEVGPQKIELYCTEPDATEERADAKRCSLERGSVSLRFSKPVHHAQLARHFVTKSRRAKSEPSTDDLVSDVDLANFLELAPGKKYQITLQAGLTASDDDRLLTDRVFDFETTDYEPRLDFRDLDGGPEVVIESARPQITLHVQAMNVPSFEAVRAPLDEAQLLSLLAAGRRTFAAVQELPAAVSSTISTKQRRNEEARASIDLPSALRAKGQSGLFALATRAAGLPDDVRLVSVTDLGLSTKWSPHGGLVWVTRLSTGAPVADASVSLRRRGHEAYATRTSADGLATIPAEIAESFTTESREPVVLVRAAGDVALARLPAQSARLMRPLAMLFTERRLYRPGETAYVKGIFRTPSPQGLRTRPGERVQIEAVDDQARPIFAASAVLDAFGAFSCAIPIPRDVRLGFASVRARAVSGLAPPSPQDPRSDSDWQAYARFTIDEFRSVEMKLELHADRRDYVALDRAQIALRGRYLFDAPMHDASVRIRATRSATSFSPPALAGFATDGHGFLSPAVVTDVVQEADVVLDHDGQAQPAILLALPQQLGPERVRVHASIADVSKAFEVDAETSFIVHPSELYVGLRLDPGRQGPWLGMPAHVEVAAASWKGPLRADVPVHVELLARTRDDAQTISTGRTCDLVTTARTVACDLAVTEPGRYWVTARALDARGRPAWAATSFEVAKDAPPPALAPPAPVKASAPESPPTTFEQACRTETPPSDRYGSLWLERAGAWDAPLAIGKPLSTCLRGVGGLSLFTQEREGVLAHELVRVTRPGVLREVAVTAAQHPNVTLALHSVLGRTRPFPSGAHADEGHPTFSHDAEPIRVARPAERELEVTIDVGAQHRPGEELEARVHVTDGNGRPAVAQITLWAVDQGALELEPFNVPNASAVFGEERESQVATTDTRESLLWERGGGSHRSHSPKVRMGATSVSAQTRVGRAVFRPTAWFLPNLVSGPDGTATARVKLPENLTTWRVFAVAASALEGFGEAESSFVSKKPLMARPALPRFLRTGDRFDAMAVLDSLHERPLQVSVQMRASGALSGSGAAKLTLPAAGHVPVRFSVTAARSGTSYISFRVTARGGPSDEVTIEESVVSPTTLETVVLSGETRTRVDEPLGDLRLARSDVGGLEFRVASTPLVGLAESLAQLIDYPYGCTEQLSSRLVPLVRLRTLGRKLGVALPRDVDAAVRSAVASLLGHQRADGGFGFWQESDHSEPWLTLGALSALQASQQAGFVVPQAALERALESLEKAEGLDAPSRAMLEDLLASFGRPREKQLRALVAEQRLPLFAQALLAHGLAKVDLPLARQVLSGVASRAKLTGAGAIMSDEPDLPKRTHLSSDARTTALSLRAFVAVDPGNPLLTKLSRGLLSLRRAGRWSTTQETAWALVALDDARAAFATSSGGKGVLSTSFDGVEVSRASAASISVGTIPMSKLLATPGGALSFRAEGAPLFYEAILRYSRKDPPRTPFEHGIHVARSLKLSRGGVSMPAQDLRVGDTVDVELVLASAVSRELVVLDDPIPAGFEAVNQRFAESQARVGSDAGVGVTHRELRDDRVVTFFDRLEPGVTSLRYPLRVIAAGRFAHPPAKAECMYAPDVFGRTEASVVETH